MASARASDPDDLDSTVVRPDAAPQERRVRWHRPRLAWRDARGAHTQALHELVVLGSAPGAGVVVDDPAVSRVHAELDPRPDGLWVRDLGSRNGTFVSAIRVTGARVPDGATVRVGDTVVEVRYEAEPDALDLWPEPAFGPLVGQSVAMRALFARLARLAALDSTVLIQGETGTGKELVARAIHEASPRAAGPLVVVDCAALPEALLEAELFGHAKGAFTGAQSAREGALEAADGGTVFLDEIGELPLAMQPKLLRAIESRTVRRLGEAQHRRVDVRFLSATHRDLRAMVNTGAFREDLYFRLAVLPVAVPPLRERLGDLPLLLARFLPPEHAAALGAETARELSARAWPGNVRELRNFAERLVALGPREAFALAREAAPSAAPPAPPAPAPSAAPPSPAATAASDAPTIDTSVPLPAARDRWNDAFERAYLRALLEQHRGNIPAAAQQAGVARTYVYRLLRKHDL